MPTKVKNMAPKRNAKHVQALIKLMRMLQSANQELPSPIALLISEFALNPQPIKIAYRTDASIRISKDPDSIWSHDQIIIPRNAKEQTVTLEHPQLLGNDACPFALSFDVSFPGIPQELHHGGILFGHKNKASNRWIGVSSLKNGAQCSVIDWIPKGIPERNTSFCGMRIYGTAEPKMFNPEWNMCRLFGDEILPKAPTRWKVIFHEENRCDLFLDGKKLDSFTCFSKEGLIGFWSCCNSGINIRNLDIVLL